MIARQDNSVGTFDFLCDSNATGDSTQSMINNNEASTSRDGNYPFNFSEDALDGIIDEDTRHSAGSSSFCHQVSFSLFTTDFLEMEEF